MNRLPDFPTLIVICALALVPPLTSAAASSRSVPACDAADPRQAQLQVEVTGMRSTKGNITITIYPDDSRHFLDGKYKVARQSVPVKRPMTRACFALPAPGTYAVALFHDENDNGHFDTTMLGVPAEGYGFSRNPTLYFGPPKLSQVRIRVHAGDDVVHVEMKYW